MQLDRQDSSEEDRLEPGWGMQCSKQCWLTLCIEGEIVRYAGSEQEELRGEGKTYADQGAGISDGGFCLHLLDDGAFDILLLGGRVGAGAEEGHFGWVN